MVGGDMKATTKVKRNNLIELASALLLIIAVNIIASYTFARFDLTAEKRYSISETTKTILENLDDYVVVKVYLEGDLPPGYKRLHNATRELLDEFRAYSKDLQFEFIDPAESEDRNERLRVYKELAQQGLAYYNIPVENKDGFAQKIIFPSVLVSYRDKDIPVNLLQSSSRVPSDADLNNSIQNLELNLISAIRKLTSKRVPTVVFSYGHGEADNMYTADIAMALMKTYTVGQIEIKGNIMALTKRIKSDKDSTETFLVPRYDLLVIAKPDSAFSDRDQFIIDQYLMHGGKIMWLLDMTDANMDSLRTSVNAVGMRKDLRLQEMLFTYGARVNYNLVLNRNALAIATAEGALRTWDYFPIALPVEGNIITKNLNAVKTKFVSSIDLVGSDKIKKTPLLKTDNRSRIMRTPVAIDLVDIIYRGPNPALYRAPAQTVAVLLEGKFESYFSHRPIARQIADNKIFDVKYLSPETKQIVISDGDMILNQVMETANGPMPYPLGYDRFTRKYFDNKKFILNAMNYMLGDEIMIQLRNKEFKIRLLNKEEIKNHRLKWQIINTVVPIFVIILMGMIFGFIKRRKYAR
jgi:ABC-2 type transport system permease protein